MGDKTLMVLGRVPARHALGSAGLVLSPGIGGCIITTPAPAKAKAHSWPRALAHKAAGYQKGDKPAKRYDA